MKKITKKITTILLAVAFLFMFAACSEGSGGRTSGGVDLESFNGGDKAVIMEFHEQAPPSRIRDQSLQPFTVRLKVENLGEYSIEPNSGFVTLTGFNHADLNLKEGSKPLLNLRGFKKQGENTIPGGVQQVVFNDLKYIPSIVSGTVPLTIFANACYPYETRATAIICISGDTMVALDKRSKICELQEKKSFANSGGPIKIGNVEQFPLGGHSIQILFDIIHVRTSSDANVYERGSIDSNCKVNGVSPSSSEALFVRDRITYIVETGIEGLNCEATEKGTNTVTLTGDKYTVSCIQDTKGQEEFPKPISIRLQYDYIDRISKTVSVDHIDK